jgi:hypothetical protein
LRAKDFQEKAWEAERDRWFNEERPMKELTKTWTEKRIEKEEKGEDSGGDCDFQGREDPPCAEINMVFELPKGTPFARGYNITTRRGGRKSQFLET